MIIAIANQKGGVGKTTTAVALAYNLARLGHRTALIDIDPQANATTTMGLDPDTVMTMPNMFTVIEGESSLEDAYTETTHGVWLVPSHIALAHSERALYTRMSRERILFDMLKNHRGRFDVTIIDAPPALGVFSYMALVACDTVIAPIQSEPYAIDGLTMLLTTLGEVQHYGLNDRCDLGGAVLTMYDQRRNVDKRVHSTMREMLGDVMFSPTIPRDVRMVEVTETGDLAHFDGESNAAVAYKSLAREVESRWLA